MKKIKYWALVLICFIPMALMAQIPSTIVVKDISNFWSVFDEVASSQDTTFQKTRIQESYLDLGSKGLCDLINIRHLTASDWVKSINSFPLFWQTIRPKTLAVVRDTMQISQLLTRFESIYSEFKRPAIYFVIGCIKTGGTTSADRVLIGTEIATGDSTVNTDGLNPFLKNIFHQSQGVIGLVAHELGHTQQIGGDKELDGKSNLLGFCLREGACDFIAELITHQDRVTPYIQYGQLHEKDLWQKFKKEMFGTDASQWLYNGAVAKDGAADLGYFMGYTICKYYYQHAANKTQVVKEIFQLNYEDKEAVKQFFLTTGYSNKFSN